MLKDWTLSEKVDKISAEAERFFTRLIMKADDYGNFFGHPSIIKSYLFPHKHTLALEDVSKWILECVSAELIQTYEVQDKPYIHIHDFGQRLRAMKGRYPPPQGGQSSPKGGLEENTKSKHEVEHEIEIEKKGIEFTVFWDLYDKKVGDREKLMKKWAKIPFEEQQKIIDYIPNYKIAQPEKKYRKNPDTFFNNKSWNDEIINSNKNGTGTATNRQERVSEVGNLKGFATAILENHQSKNSG